jgi:hypothetical protein
VFRSRSSIVFRFVELLGLWLVLSAGAVAQEAALPELNTAAVFEQPPYRRIQVVERVPGWDRFSQGMPECWKRYARFRTTIPRKMETDLYQYPGMSGLVRHNVSAPPFPTELPRARCIAAYNVLPGIDDTAEGFPQYKVWYRISTDGGETRGDMKPLVQKGPEYSPQHPNKFVWVGKNGFVYALTASMFTSLRNGEVFMPFFYSPLDADGKYDNPLKASTFSQLACAVGTWNEARTDLTWDVVSDISLGAEYSSRGLSEAAVVELKPRGHILMVLRGSNHVFTGKQRGGNWKVLSTDSGRTWSKVTPFTFSNGEDFYAPAQKSGLVRSSKTGKVYWIGHMSRTRPKGNVPRRPMVIAELDEKKLGLRRETVTIIDDRKPEESEEFRTDFAGFVEDVNTRQILVSLVRRQGDPARLTAVIEVK